MATAVGDYQKQGGTLTQPQAKTGGFNPAPQKKRGGIGGFLEGIVKGAAEPFGYLINTDIVNPIKSLSADFTHNKVAAANANKESNREIGLGENGTDLVGGLKKLGGNSAQALLSVAAPGISSIKGGAALGAATGAAAASTNRDSSLADVLEGGAIGGATGGALSAGGKILSKLTKAPGAAGRAGAALEAENSGLSRGGTLKGGRQVTPEIEEDLSNFMREGSKKYVPEGIKADTPRAQSSGAQKVFNRVNEELDNNLKAINRSITKDEYNKLATDIDFKINSNAGAEEGAFSRKVKTLAKDKDIAGLEKLRQQADDIAYKMNGEAGDTAKAQEAFSVRDAIDDFVTGLKSEDPNVQAAIDNYKAVKGDYGKAKDLLELTSKGAKQAKGGKVPFTGIDVGKQTVAGAKNKVGGFLSNIAGKAPDLTAPIAAQNAGNFTSGILRQGVTSSLGAVPEAVPQDMTPAVEPIDNTASQDDTPAQDTSVDPFSPDNLRTAVAAILSQGGKMKDVTEYLSVAKSLNDLTGSATTKPKALNSTQLQQKNNAVSALKDIKNIRTELANDGEAALKSSLPGGSFTQRLTGTTGYTAAKKNIVDVIARLRSGAAITPSEAQMYERQLPGSFDSPEEASKKLDRLEELFTSFTYPDGGATADLSSLGI